MSTKSQKIRNKFKKKKNLKKRALGLAPFRRGTCSKVFITTPKKPNSAARKTIKVILCFNKQVVLCHVPGIKHNLQKYSSVLVRGANVRDLPGIKYRAVRGKFDLKKVYERTKARSKYGITRLSKS